MNDAEKRKIIYKYESNIDWNIDYKNDNVLSTFMMHIIS